ncbi:methyl-accepting chemotaxis protein [[Pseudomonas] carboxydohydrogena]|uniref:Methyl-accepting chemotaxis protein n=1 Tax=Afipia carboxydohydrogena TaxID=290 RepID=A0ABY8BQA7_AFICR|nr:methyl-accepting chemotaxis protein [[Pseudomonas] carboxydohydrogena]WEF52165.1 methyl-accepting chemotaxis protein [[Pseudomonas] carboxydohydrogena]
MSFLSRFRILPKILSVILLLSTIACGLAALGISALKSLNDATDRMESGAARAMLAQQLAVNLITMNRAEFQMSTDPRPDNIKAAHRAIEAETKLFEERLQAFSKRSAGSTRHHVAVLETGWTKYREELEGTYRAAAAVTDFRMTEQLEQLRNEAIQSTKVANELRASLREISETLQNDVTRETEAAAEEYNRTSNLLMIVAGIGIVMGLMIGFLIGQYGIALPIRRTVALLQKLASGDYQVEVAGADRKDEVGDIAQTAMVFKDNGLAKIRLEAEQREATERAAAQRKADMVQLADQFERSVGAIVDQVASAATEMQATASQLTASAQETSAQSNSVSSAADLAAANVTSVAGSAEELGASVVEIGRQTEQSSQMTRSAVGEIEAAATTVNELSQAAARIDSIADIISTIASQTNLLALNATIEAARAGEAGRGFAVVASEVKELATQTAKATAEISTQLAGIQNTTGNVVQAIQRVTHTVREIDNATSAISAAVEQQGAATREIVQAVNQASVGTGEVTSNIAGVASAAEQTGIAANQVQGASADLAKQSEQLRYQMDAFLTNVRAA